MSAQLIDGKSIAGNLHTHIGAAVEKLQTDHHLTPRLAVVLVGNDAASQVYVRNKGLTAEKVGMDSLEFRLPSDVLEETLLAKIDELNRDPQTHGILVQFPVPAHINAQRVMAAIEPAKDVDGLHPINAGRLASGLDAMTPCTPLGCVFLAKATLGDLSGHHAVVLGRSNLVGKPVAQLLLKEDCTVTLAHSHTRNLPILCQQADILIAAVGRPEMVKGSWVQPSACVIDVGINRIDAPEKGLDAEGHTKTKLVGDVAFAEVVEVAAHITPVPGGVGPMTIACLMHNTFIAACRQNGIDTMSLPAL